MYLRSVAVPEKAISSDGVETFDLGVNPLSHILIGLRPLNDTGTLANFQNYRSICAALNRVSVLWQGQSIFNMRGEDVAAFNWYRWGMIPFQGQHDNVDNERRCAVLPILMGRWPYSKKSCFPSSRRGDLVLELDMDIADTGYDGLRLSVEMVELPDAKPTEYERKISINQTMAATGDQDIDLPLGNISRGIFLFGTTGFGGAAPAPSLGRLKVLVDNVEHTVSASDWEMMQAEACLWGRQPPYDHKHTLNAAGAGIEETTAIFDQGEEYTNYAYLDFDPTGDDAHVIDVRQVKSFRLRPNVETADAVRVVPVEVVPASTIK